MSWNKIIECVPNFSEGRDLEKIDQIVAPFRILNRDERDDIYRSHTGMLPGMLIQVYQTDSHTDCFNDCFVQSFRLADKSYNQTVMVFIITVIKQFYPGLNTERGYYLIYHLPVFLYEKSATASHRENLASVRKGEFEGMAEKIKLPEWQPDFGPAERHPTAGTVAIGARMPLVAYNINLSTDNLEIATKIAKNIRHINGGLRYVKAMGVELKERNITQVSINMTDYTRTALYRAFELVRIEARRYGVTIVGSEIIGLVPMEALIDTASYYLGLENFSMQQVLEARIME